MQQFIYLRGQLDTQFIATLVVQGFSALGLLTVNESKT